MIVKSSETITVNTVKETLIFLEQNHLHLQWSQSKQTFMTLFRKQSSAKTFHQKT